MKKVLKTSAVVIGLFLFIPCVYAEEALTGLHKFGTLADTVWGTAVPAHRHINPDGSVGGWVADTAYVAPTAYIGPDAEVYDEAGVGGNAQVTDGAAVYDQAVVFDNAQVSWKTKVYDHARVDGNAIIGEYGGYVLIHGNAEVTGEARVSGITTITDNAVVSGDARVRGHTQIIGHARVLGGYVGSDGADVLIRDYAKVSGNPSIGANSSPREGNRRDFVMLADDAQVSDNARIIEGVVEGNARLSGEACLYEGEVRGNARMSGRAKMWSHLDSWPVLSGDVHLTGEAVVTEGEHSTGVFTTPQWKW